MAVAYSYSYSSSSSSSSSSAFCYDSLRSKELTAKNLSERKSLDSYSESYRNSNSHSHSQSQSHSNCGKDESPSLSPINTPSPTTDLLNATTRDELVTMRVMMMEMMKKMEQLEGKESASAAEIIKETSSNESLACSSAKNPPRHHSTVPYVLGIGTVVDDIHRSTRNSTEAIIQNFHVRGEAASLLRQISTLDWRDMSNSNFPGSAAVPASPHHIEATKEVDDTNGMTLLLHAVQEAITDWGGDKSDLTHIIGIRSTEGSVSGIEFSLMRALQLPLTTQRLCIQSAGCFGCISGLKTAKAIAAEDPKHRVLVISCEVAMQQRRDNGKADTCAALFSGDGVGAFIVGCNARATERPVYEIHKSLSYVNPDLVESMPWDVNEQGMLVNLNMEKRDKIYSNIEPLVNALFEDTPIDGSCYEDHYWAIHPGDPIILQAVIDDLQLDVTKADASYSVLQKYGNMSSASLIFVLNEIRKLYPKHMNGYSTNTGKTHLPASSWIPAVAIGPGLGVEGCLLKWTGIRDTQTL